jgi:enoyl-[acyl-carrier protein] reductase II
MSLVPQVANAVDIPIIAAGGIADGRGFLASLALGAEGVQIGTRFVCSEEADVHINYKEAILKAKDRDALVTGRSTGHPIRVLKNKFSKEFIELESKGTDSYELAKLNVGRLKLAVRSGDVVNGSLMAGQISGLIDEVKSCEDIIESIIREGADIIDRLSSLKGGDEL